MGVPAGEDGEHEMNDTMLHELGFSPRWQALMAPHAEAGLAPARVVRVDRGGALVATAAGVVPAKSAVRLLKAAAGPGDLPAVGDWVALRLAPAPSPALASFPAPAPVVGSTRDRGHDAAAGPTAELAVPLIEAVLPRASALTRGAAGRTSDAQVLAANVDVVFVVHPLDGAPNLRRLERELSLAWESGARPAVVLTKADLSADADGARTAVESVAIGVDVLVVNALAGEGLPPLLALVAGRLTAVLIGPSGAGKSTLVNALLGEERQATREVRVSDGRGRHTTVARELIPLPGGGLLIDTPGLRGLALTGTEDGIAAAFPDVEALAVACRFRDCSHQAEPDCAVRAAVAAGELPADRLASYHKLRREARLAAAKTDARLRAEDNRQRKIMGRVIKDYHKKQGRD